MDLKFTVKHINDLFHFIVEFIALCLFILQLKDTRAVSYFLSITNKTALNIHVQAGV